MLNTSIIHQGKWSYRVKKTLENAILSGPHAVQQLGRHLRVALKELFFATGWCRYWETAIVFLLHKLCCTLLEPWDMEGVSALLLLPKCWELHDLVTGCDFRLPRSKRDPAISEVWITVSEWLEEVGLPALHCRHGHFRRFGLEHAQKQLCSEDQISEVFPSPVPQCNSSLFLNPLSADRFIT